MIKKLWLESFQHVFRLLILRPYHQLAHSVVNARVTSLLIDIAELREAHLQIVRLLLSQSIDIYRGHWLLIVRLAVIVEITTSFVVVQLHRFSAKTARDYFSDSAY